MQRFASLTAGQRINFLGVRAQAPTTKLLGSSFLQQQASFHVLFRIVGGGLGISSVVPESICGKERFDIRSFCTKSRVTPEHMFGLPAWISSHHHQVCLLHNTWAKLLVCPKTSKLPFSRGDNFLQQLNDAMERNRARTLLV